MPGVGTHYWNDARGKPDGIAGLSNLAQIPRNAFANGAFIVNERFGAPVFTNANSPGYFMDRWFAVITGTGAITTIFTSIGFPNGGPTLNMTTAGNISVRYAGVESLDATKLRSQQLTVSLTYQYSKIGNAVTSATIGVVTGTGNDQNFTTNGSYATGNLNLATSNIDLTLSGPQVVNLTFVTTNNMNEISVRIDYTVTTPGTANNFTLLGISMCQGNVPVPYNVATYNEELASCQRYFQRFNLNASGVSFIGFTQNFTTTLSIMSVNLPVRMRIRSNPSLVGTNVVIFTGATQISVTSIGANNGHTAAVAGLNLSVAAGLTVNQVCLVFTFDTVSDIFLDAEL